MARGPHPLGLVKVGRFDVVVSGARPSDVAHFIAAVEATAGAGDAENMPRGGDFAVRDIDLQGGERLRLHSCPSGNRRPYLPMARMAHSHGGVVLVDISMLSPQQDLARFLDTLQHHRPGLPAAVGLTGLHCATVSQYRSCQDWLHRLAPRVPAIPLQPCNPRHVRTLLELLAALMCGASPSPAAGG